MTPPPSTTKLAGLLAVLALAALGAWFVSDGLRSHEPTRLVARSEVLKAREDPVPLPSGSSGRRTEEGHDLGAGAEDSAGPSSAAREGTSGAEASPTTLPVFGIVRDLQTYAPRGGGVLSLASLDSEGGVLRDVPVDEAGEFELELSPGLARAGDLVAFELRDRSDGPAVHRALLPVSARVELLVPPEQVLSARVHLSGLSPELDALVGSVRLDQLTNHDQAFFLASAPLGPDGTFVAAARPANWCETVRVTVAVDDTQLGFVDAPVESLLRGDHVIELPVTTRKICIAAPSGAPIEGATVLLGLSQRDVEWSEQRVSGTSGCTRLLLRVDLDRVDLVVDAEGFEPHVGPLGPESTERVLLVPEDPTQADGRGRLAGRVFAPDGELAPGAFVWARIAEVSPELGVRAGFRSAHANEAGEFSLRLEPGRSYEVGAFLKSVGSSPSTRVRVDEGARLDFLIDAAAEVRLLPRVAGSAPPGLALGGALEYCLIDVEYENQACGSLRFPPYVLPSVPTGEYLLLAHLPGTRLFGAAAFRVSGSEATYSVDVDLALEAPPRVLGKSVDAEGEQLDGVRVVARPAGSYALAPLDWTSTVTRANGTFDLPALGLDPGDASAPVTLTLSSKGRATQQIELVAGAPEATVLLLGEED